MPTSVREYAVLYTGGQPASASGGSLVGGGNAILDSPAHALDGDEHTGKGDIHSSWTLVAGGEISPTPGDPPLGAIVFQVKTTSGAPTHEASEGTPCWVAPDDDLYVNGDGADGWVLQGSGGAIGLDDLTDATISSPEAADRLRYNGSAWVNSDLHWEPMTDYDGLAMIDSAGGLHMHEVSH